MTARARTSSSLAVLAVLTFAALPSAFAQGAARTAEQRAEDAFKDGLEARRDSKWPEVAMHMRNAIQAQGQENSRRVGRGFLQLRGEEYLPHYYLADALFRMNDCVGAVTEWSISEQQGAVRRRPDLYQGLQNGYKQCALRGVLPPTEFNALLAGARQSVSDLTAMEQRLAQIRQEHSELWRQDLQDVLDRSRGDLQSSRTRLNNGAQRRSGEDLKEAKTIADRGLNALRSLEASLGAAVSNATIVRDQVRTAEEVIARADATDREIEEARATLTPGLAATRQNGRELLGRARERLKDATRTLNQDIAREAARSAQDAASVLDQVLEQTRRVARTALEQQLVTAVNLATQVFSSLDLSMTNIERLFTDKASIVTSDMAATRDVLRKETDALRRRFERARKSESVTAIEDAMRLAEEARLRLVDLAGKFGPPSLVDRGVHAALAEGARSYLRGDHQAVLTTLDLDKGLRNLPMLQAHVHLFRAASLYALYVKSGEKDESLRTRALTEAGDSKRTDPAIAPDVRAFSPRFIAFFRTATASPQPPAN